MECMDLSLERKRKRKRNRPRLSTLEGEDRISELPDEILVSILSRLTLREAALTSVLSKRWRYIWTHISTLNFDIDVNDISLYCPPSLERHHSKAKYSNRRLPCIERCKFINWVFSQAQSRQSKYSNRRLQCIWSSEYTNWVTCVLAQHKSPNIDEFRVCFNSLNKTSISIFHIDGWIEFALSKKVHTIELDLLNAVELRIDPQEHYTFPYRLLGFLNNSHKNPCMFVGFKSLKTLSLKAVDVCDEAIEYFLSNCPLLERLCLHDNDVLRNLRVVCPSLLLRHLEVVRCLCVKTIEIRDTNMVSFTYAERKTGTKILLQNAPLLTEVSIDCGASMHFANTMLLMELSHYLPQLEILQLKIDHMRQEIFNAYIFPELKNLKQFVLIVDRWTNDCLLGFLVMIKNWANLQRFLLQLRSQLSDKHKKERKAARRDLREVVEYHHHCLKVVEIAGYCNYNCDFELVKQIIENAVALEKVIIDPHDPDPELPFEGDEWCGKSELREIVAARKSAEQLRTQVPDGVELVIL